jgi:hypothetical protein
MKVIHVDSNTVDVNKNHCKIVEYMMRKVNPNIDLEIITIDKNIITLHDITEVISNLKVDPGTIISTNFTISRSDLSKELEEAIAVLAQNCFFICAGGNSNRFELDEILPASVPGSIVVGALNKSGGICGFNSVENRRKFNVYVTGTNQEYIEGNNISRITGTSISAAYYAAYLSTETPNLEGIQLLVNSDTLLTKQSDMSENML